MKHRSTKTYGHELGLSACFRQWRAKSHCRFLHGYPLSFHFVFASHDLDENGWVVDFGALKPLKEKLIATFDHKLVVAGDDPMLKHLVEIHDLLIADILVLPAGVGCERFARLAYSYASEVIHQLGLAHRVVVLSCECSEHGGNSGIYQPEIA